MPLSVVVGGQYGSEGKGKLVSHIAAQAVAAGSAVVVRCGGPNAGHTADGPDGRELLRQLPSGAVVPGCRLFMAAGMQIEVELLLSEIERCAIGPDRLTIDPNAVIITDHDVATEQATGLRERVASTLSGTGSAIARKVMRAHDVLTAREVRELAPLLGDVTAAVNRILDEDPAAHVILEGTQGSGLSLHHGPFPYTTGRDTTAAGVLSEAGLSPLLVDDVALVLRTYPIRVAGNSGPLETISWEEIARRARYPTALAEYTTVTGRLRRVGEFDWPLAARAVQLNRPTSLALHGADYLDHDDLGCRKWEDLGLVSRRFVRKLERHLGVPVRWIFTGPDGDELIDRGADLGRPAGARRSSRRVVS